MIANKNLLIGKWEFIKAEKHNGSEWEPTNHTNGMSWEFHPEYIGEQKNHRSNSRNRPTGQPNPPKLHLQRP